MKLNAAARLLATKEVNADAFEGWINSLQYEYKRPSSGTDYVIVDASLSEVSDKLYDEGWGKARRSDIVQFSKGEHSVKLDPEGTGRTRITDIK